MGSIFSKVSGVAKNAVNFPKKNNFKRLKNMRSIFSKVGVVEKNDIYLKRYKNRKECGIEIQKNQYVEFSFGKYLIKIINSRNPLFQKVLNLRHNIFFGDKDKFHEDNDEFDKYCDHLVVIDTSINNEFVVGTYRLLFKPKNMSDFKFYSETEFNITNLKRKNENLLEAGRSCVLEGYRNGRIIRLLWRGLATYITNNKVELIFGCASFPSSNYLQFSDQLNYLKMFHFPPNNYAASPLDHLKANFKIKSIGHEKSEKVFRSLPPLIKAYIRAGAWISPGATVDRKFNTTDVLIILKTKNIIKKYSDLEIN